MNFDFSGYRLRKGGYSEKPMTILDPEPRALFFQRNLILGCGTGLYATQHRAVLFIRRTLKKMGILSA